jgi:ABC-type dipeptide/oligopeptide/nickel transport system ATPase component
LKYKKLLATTPYHARGGANLFVEANTKTVVIGRRDASSTDTAFLGKVLEQTRTASLLDYNVAMDIAFPHVVGIFGSRGSGKSYDLGVILEGIFSADRGKVADAAIVFDIQDQFWTLGFSPDAELDVDATQLSELAAWGIAPAHFANVHTWIPSASDTQVPGATPFSLAASQLRSDDWLAILDLERYSAMGQALLSLLASSPGATPVALVDLCDPATLPNFQQGTVDGLRWRLESLALTEIIGAMGVPVDALLQKGSLSVILMRNLADSVRGLIVGVIARLVADRMGRLQQARKVAMRTKTPFGETDPNLTAQLWLVLDEAHVLAPSDGSTAASAPLIDYVKRGRDAGLSLIFATQQPSAVDSKLMSQVDLTLTHMLGFEADLSAAIARMPTRSTDYDIDRHTAVTLSDIIRSLGPGECVIADGASSRTFLAKIRPRASAHGGSTPK